MPADEVTHGADVESSRARTGPRHAAPKKPLFTRFHMPAGKAIALAAMPTAVLMGMGFTPTLAVADGNDSTTPSSNSLTADEYKDCVAALEDEESAADEDGATASPTPSPSAGESEADEEGEDGEDGDAGPAPSPSAGDSAGDSAGKETDGDQGADGRQGAGDGSSSSSDSGSDDEDEPAPPDGPTGGTAPASPSPSPSETDRNVLEKIGDAIEDVFTGGGKEEEEGASPAPSPSASESAAGDASGTVEDTAGTAADAAGDPARDTAERAGEAVEDAAEESGRAVEEAREAEEAEEAAEDATAPATATPSPSESAGTDPEDCPVATDAEGGIDNAVPLPDDPWYLNASSLLLKGASYKGVVEVKTANGSVKKVLKYVISDGTDIGDLHQTVQDDQSGKTYHVQAAEGSTSTIRGGDTVMYTESISGNLLGLIPITFDPEHPPPLDIPLIYFTKVKVVQAGQFGGNLHVPGLQQYITD
ncbi:hypothetical protein [Streptomyces poriticola]|uniref:hypothetical protein n=1 Tax=Streptomyces poriticola TaxID=3120506 RepID=UPI002FCE1986